MSNISNDVKTKIEAKKMRKYAITINDTQDFCCEHWEEFAEGVIKTSVAYIKLAHEQGTDGKNHIQGYIEMKNPCIWKAVKKLFAPFNVQAHVEVAISPDDADDYIGNAEFIHKDGRKKGGLVFWVFSAGERCKVQRKSGKKWAENLTEIKALIDSGTPIDRIWDSHFVTMVYAHRAISAYHEAQCRAYQQEEGEKWKKKYKDYVLHSTKEAQGEEQAWLDTVNRLVAMNENDDPKQIN